MKTTKKLLAAATALAFAMPLAADNHGSEGAFNLAIHHVHVKLGHGPKFQAGMEAYSKCLADGDYDGSYSVWQAVDGDRTGFHIVARFDMWSELDEEDEVSDACWANDEIRMGVFDHMSSWETHYAQRMPDWSQSPDDYSIVTLHNFRVEDGAEFRSMVGQVVEEMKKADYEHMGTWYDMETAGYWQPDYFVVEHYENFAAMDEERKGAGGIMRDAMGEEDADAFWDAFGETLADEKGYWAMTLQRQDSMGYTADDD